MSSLCRTGVLLTTFFMSTVTVGADARASDSDRADARRILAPMQAVQRAMDRDGRVLEERARLWASGVKPCLTEAYAKLKAEAEAGEISATESSTYGSILFFVAISDAAVELAEPLDRELARAQRSYRRMPISDRVLRAGARAKARELGALRGQQDIDTCDFARRWEATGHSLLELASLAPSVARLAPDPAVDRAMKRLRRLGVSRRAVSDFEAFPLAAVAAPALDVELLPPDAPATD